MMHEQDLRITHGVAPRRAEEVVVVVEDSPLADPAGWPGLIGRALAGGAVAATLDLAYAILRQAGRDRSPEWTLQSVASGWFGNDAFASGTTGMWIGLATHYGILWVIAALYVVASRYLIDLRASPWVCGLEVGIAIYLLMNFVVLPLSAFPFELTYTTPVLLEGFASHALLVGLPIALIAAWRRRPPSRALQ